MSLANRGDLDGIEERDSSKESSKRLLEAQGRIGQLKKENRRLRHRLDEIMRVQTGRARLAEEVGAAEVLGKIPMFVVRADAEGTISYVDGMGLKRLGMERGEFIGKSLASLFPSQARRLEGLEINETLVFEVSSRESDASWCFENFIVRHKDGIIGVAVDVTERQRAEEQKRRFISELQEAQRLESLGTLAAGVAHDFNNLLTVVVGHLSLLERKLHGDPRVQQNLQKALQASDQATELASQMLAYSGQGRFINNALNLSEVVAGMEKLIHAAGEPGVMIELDLACDLDEIKGDVSQIRQVVMNLITNSMEAMRGDGGRLTVRTGALEADEAYIERNNLQDRIEPGPLVFVEVEDTGCGMSPCVLPRIFDPFFSTKFTGRGLGLAAVQGIAQSHHGGVSVCTQPHEGSRFRIHFPLSGRSKARITPVPRPTSSVASAGGTLLIVDDEPLVLELGKLALEAGGFDVISVVSGKDAIDLYARNSNEIDAAIVDLTMPHMGGEETLAGLRSINPEVSCFLMSGYSHVSLAEKIADLQIDGFIQKPFRPVALVDIVSSAIGGRQRGGSQSRR